MQQYTAIPITVRLAGERLEGGAMYLPSNVKEENNGLHAGAIEN